MLELDDYLSYLISNNQAQGAISLLSSLVAEHPKNVPIHRRLADIYRMSGDVTKAISQLDTIGELLLEAGELGGAIKTVETIINLKSTQQG